MTNSILYLMIIFTVFFSDSLVLDCVNCYVKGTFEIAGTLKVGLGSSSVKQRLD